MVRFQASFDLFLCSNVLKTNQSTTGGAMDLRLPLPILEWVNKRRGDKSQQAYIIQCLQLLEKMERSGFGVQEDKKG